MSGRTAQTPGGGSGVPPRAVRWIVSYLRSAGKPGSVPDCRATLLSERGLTVLKVPELKLVVKRLDHLVQEALRLDDANANAAVANRAYARFRKPRSGALKAEWVECLRRTFHSNPPACTVAAPDGDPIWGLVERGGGGAGSASASASAGGGPSSSAVAAVAAGRAAARATAPSAAAARAAAASTTAAAASRAASAAAARAAAVFAAPVPPRQQPVHAPPVPSQLQAAQFVQNYAPYLAGPNFAGSSMASIGADASMQAAPPNFAYSPWINVANRTPPRQDLSSSSRISSPASRNRKRPHAALTSSSKRGKKKEPVEPDFVDMTVPPEKRGAPRNGAESGLARAVRIKREKGSSGSSSHNPLSATAGAASAATGGSSTGGAAVGGEDYYDSRPRDAREWSLMGQMRAMGFTDEREILNGLRHVERENGQAMLLMDTAGHVEAAMMWIVAQREEAEEARKMDMARMSSEFDQSAEEMRRKATEQRLQEASLEDIVGVDASEDGKGSDGAVRHRSKFFHFSTLLHSPLVRSIFLSISSDVAKKELVRYLKLEQKATQWYGMVLPWAYFHYTARKRIENWADGGDGTDADNNDDGNSKASGKAEAKDVCTLIRQEADTLEQALFSLSEQENNGLQNVPKIFIKARQVAVSMGLPDGPEGQATGEKVDDSDDDIVVVMEKAAASVTNNGSGKKGDKRARKSSTPSSADTATGKGPQHHSCSSSSSLLAKKQGNDEIIEIM